MKPCIICIVGASGSGKTTASFMLQMQFDWQAIVSYTTRPIRAGEMNGIDHWFVSPKRKPEAHAICAYTQFGGYEYWTEWRQFSSSAPNIYVIDEKGLIDLMSKEQAPFSFSLYTIKLNRLNLDGISEQRIARDKERNPLPDEFYDYVINNDGSIEELRTKLYSVAENIIKKLYNNGSTTK